MFGSVDGTHDVEFYAIRDDSIVFLDGDTESQAGLIRLRTCDHVRYHFYLRHERLAWVSREHPANDIDNFVVVEWRGVEGDQGHLNHRLQKRVPTVFLCHCEHLFHSRGVSTSAEGGPWIVVFIWTQVMVQRKPNAMH